MPVGDKGNTVNIGTKQPRKSLRPLLSVYGTFVEFVDFGQVASAEKEQNRKAAAARAFLESL